MLQKVGGDSGGASNNTPSVKKPGAKARRARKAKMDSMLSQLPVMQPINASRLAPGQDRISTVLRREILDHGKTAFRQIRAEYFPLEGGPLLDVDTTEPTAWVPLSETGIVTTNAANLYRGTFQPDPKDVWCTGSGSIVFGVAGTVPGCNGFTAWEPLIGSSPATALVDGYRCTGLRIRLRAICNSFNNQGTVAVGLTPHEQPGGYLSTAQISSLPLNARWAVAELQVKEQSFAMLFGSMTGADGGYIRNAFSDIWNDSAVPPVLNSPNHFSPRLYLAIDGAAASTAVLSIDVEAAFECTLDSRVLTGDGNATASSSTSLALSSAASNSLAIHPKVRAIAAQAKDGDSFVGKALKFARDNALPAWDEAKSIIDELGGMEKIAKDVGSFAEPILPYLAGLL